MIIQLSEKEDWKQLKTIRLAALLTRPEAFGASFEEESNLSDNEFESKFKKSTIFGAFRTSGLQLSIWP